MGGFQRQRFAALSGSICLVSCGMAYAWLSPVLNELTDPEGAFRATSEQISWLAVNIEFGCLLTPFLASYLMNKFGRKWTMLCSIPLPLISWVLTLTTRSIKMLYIKRVLDGMGLGLAQTILPVYLSEIAEAKIRGSLISIMNVSWFGGALLQFCVGTYLTYNEAVYVNLFVPIVYFILFSFLPESPYYLMMKKQTLEAAKSIAWFRGTDSSQVSEELSYIADYMERYFKNKESCITIIHKKVYRKCFLVLVVVIMGNIATGSTTIFSYATEMFAETDAKGFLNPDTCSLAIAVIFFVMSIWVSFIIDRVGRRPLIIISSFGCFVSSLANAFFSYFKNEMRYNWIHMLTLGSYSTFVSIGLIPVMFTYQGELFPSSISNIVAAMATVIITCTSLVAVKLYFIIGSTFGMYVNYLMYATVAGFATVCLYYYAPESKNKTFNELFKELENKIEGEVQVTEELQSFKGKTELLNGS